MISTRSRRQKESSWFFKIKYQVWNGRFKVKVTIWYQTFGTSRPSTLVLFDHSIQYCATVQCPFHPLDRRLWTSKFTKNIEIERKWSIYCKISRTHGQLMRRQQSLKQSIRFQMMWFLSVVNLLHICGLYSYEIQFLGASLRVLNGFSMTWYMEYELYWNMIHGIWRRLSKLRAWAKTHPEHQQARQKFLIGPSSSIPYLIIN